MPLVYGLLGAILLVWGRRLYWAFVAIAGFLFATQLADILLAEQQTWLRLVVAIGAGLLGALLAMAVHRIAFGIAGLFAGSYLALALAQAAGFTTNPIIWAAVGGVLGAIVAVMVMDWAIIVLSSLVGAGAVVTAVDPTPNVAGLLFVGLAVAGIIVQAQQLRPRRPP